MSIYKELPIDCISKLLKDRGMTQKDLAEKTGISERSISRWNSKTPIRRSNLEKVAKVLNCSVEQLEGRPETNDIEARIKLYIKFMPTGAIDYKILDELDFFIAPASTKYHGAYEGGLFDHSFHVAKVLTELTERLDLKWERPESPFYVGMYHDLCKCDSYVQSFDGRYIYNDKQVIPGHGDKSLIIIQKYLTLTDEEIACIRWHMGAFETDTKMWEYYGRAIERFPNVLYSHTADMIASRILKV